MIAYTLAANAFPGTRFISAVALYLIFLNITFPHESHSYIASIVLKFLNDLNYILAAKTLSIEFDKTKTVTYSIHNVFILTLLDI